MSKRRFEQLDDVSALQVEVASPAVIDQAGNVDHSVNTGARRQDGAASVLSLADRRRTREPESPEQIALIRRVWGETILADPDKVSAIVRAQSVVSEESSKMLRSAVNIGRSLLDMKRILAPAEFARGLRRSGEAFHGWSASNISKMMSVAEFVDREQVSIASLPQSYSTLYEFTTLNQPQLERARSLALLRPDVRRADIKEFKRNVVERGQAKSARSLELEKVDERIGTLQNELTAARRERKALLAKQK